MAENFRPFDFHGLLTLPVFRRSKIFFEFSKAKTFAKPKQPKLFWASKHHSIGYHNKYFFLILDTFCQKKISIRLLRGSTTYTGVYLVIKNFLYLNISTSKIFTSCHDESKSELTVRLNDLILNVGRKCLKILERTTEENN